MTDHVYTITEALKLAKRLVGGGKHLIAALTEEHLWYYEPGFGVSIPLKPHGTPSTQVRLSDGSRVEYGAVGAPGFLLWDDNEESHDLDAAAWKGLVVPVLKVCDPKDDRLSRAQMHQGWLVGTDKYAMIRTLPGFEVLSGVIDAAAAKLPCAAGDTFGVSPSRIRSRGVVVHSSVPVGVCPQPATALLGMFPFQYPLGWVTLPAASLLDALKSYPGRGIAVALLADAAQVVVSEPRSVGNGVPIDRVDFPAEVSVPAAGFGGESFRVVLDTYRLGALCRLAGTEELTLAAYRLRKGSTMPRPVRLQWGHVDAMLMPVREAQ
jgi:hypothetical protein